MCFLHHVASCNSIRVIFSHLPYTSFILCFSDCVHEVQLVCSVAAAGGRDKFRFYVIFFLSSFSQVMCISNHNCSVSVCMCIVIILSLCPSNSRPPLVFLLFFSLPLWVLSTAPLHTRKFMLIVMIGGGEWKHKSAASLPRSFPRQVWKTKLFFDLLSNY